MNREYFGKKFLFLFILFNIVIMCWWLVYLAYRFLLHVLLPTFHSFRYVSFKIFITRNKRVLLGFKFIFLNMFLFCCGWGTDLEAREQLVTILFFPLWSCGLNPDHQACQQVLCPLSPLTSPQKFSHSCRLSNLSVLFKEVSMLKV